MSYARQKEIAKLKKQRDLLLMLKRKPIEKVKENKHVKVKVKTLGKHPLAIS